jgi:hypothetical protein
MAAVASTSMIRLTTIAPASMTDTLSLPWLVT